MNSENNKTAPLPRILVICGPTASGKSSLAIALAKRLNGQVISFDSMQIYRTMDIGTGKVTPEEAEGVRHRMLDVLEPAEEFSLSDFLERAKKEIAETLSEGCLPILCGGTGLYIDRLIDGTTLSSAEANEELRAQLDLKTNEELYEELLRVDPSSAEKTHPNNRKRVQRALEIYRASGIPKSEWDARSHEGDKLYDALRILIVPSDRTALYENIERRVDGMVERGLIEEARRLYAAHPSSTAAQAIGYKEFLPYFAGKQSKKEAVEAVKQASRNYAKRQLTWFRKHEKESMLLRAENSTEENCAIVLEALKKLTDHS